MIISPPQVSWVTYIIHNYLLTYAFEIQVTETNMQEKIKI